MPDLTTQLIQLVPPTLPANYCITSPQRFAIDLFTRAAAIFRSDIGASFYNRGPTTPTAANRIFDWFNTTNGRWYTWNATYGVWTSPMDPGARIADFRRMWKPVAGTAQSAAWLLDEGDGSDPITSPPTATTGAAWQVDHDFDGVFPLGAGVIPTTSPPTTVAVGDTGGAAQHTLTESEGGLGQHVHAFGKSNNAAGSSGDDAFFRQMTMTTVPSYQGTYITGSNGVIVATLTQADLFTLPPGTDGGSAPPAPTPISLLPPYRVIWWLRPTAKKYYTLPG